MSERKSTNKYYPPDYDPVKAEQEARKLSKRLKTMNKDIMTIRLMTPFSMRCLKCEEFIPKSRKFNAKKQTLPEKYLNKIRIYRFEIRCPSCNNLISFKTNPKTGDYTMDVGGVKNFPSHSDDSGSKLGNDVPENETLDQTLERLEKEQQIENDKRSGKKQDDDRDRMEIVEERLAKIQREQEADAELEKIALREQVRLEKLEQINESRKRSLEDQELLDDMITEQAFEDSDAKPGNKADITAKKSIPVVPIKVSVKKKNNPLGIKLKKKKKV
ncbi:unnamed protein product [Kluyveromyces dobzhanskii CBS 2104]|uniref:WGS project CCBQ000000000 data, contig 00016 n=1 Tax=Kluyveromyces dobzhanskii CBS 2104 TaxID=1427455 RepID=A0A0A8L279_9SACH|nr:unnamed protein product [Kluyveromyces dobzhanskii CBS 2104]